MIKSKTQINIFLDSNILISDLFWKNSFSKSLLDLKGKSNKIDIYVSALVLNEVDGYYKRTLKSSIDKINNLMSEFNSKLLREDIYEVKFQNQENHISQLTSFYKDFIDKGIITKVEVNNALLPKIVNKAIKRLPPFFDEIGTKKKQEFRDAVIWLNYIEFIKEKKLKNCFFISNNKKDFWDKNKQELHPALRKENDEIKIFESIKEFISKEEKLRKIINNTEFNSWIKKQNIDNLYFKHYISKYFKDSLIKKFTELISDLDLKKYLNDNELMAFKIIAFEEEFNVGSHTMSILDDYALADVYIHFESIGEEFKANYFNPETNKIDSVSKKVLVIVNLSLTIKKDEIHRIKDLNIFGVRDIEKYPNPPTTS